MMEIFAKLMKNKPTKRLHVIYLNGFASVFWATNFFGKVLNFVLIPSLIMKLKLNAKWNLGNNIHIHIHTCTHIYIYKYLVWYNSPWLLTKFLINICNTICNIIGHFFLSWDTVSNVNLLYRWWMFEGD